MTLKTPAQFADIAKTFDVVSKDYFKQKYFSMDRNEFGCDTTAEDFDYTWTWSSESKDFWQMAANEMRYVLFTADQ